MIDKLQYPLFMYRADGTKMRFKKDAPVDKPGWYMNTDSIPKWEEPVGESKPVKAEEPKKKRTWSRKKK